MLRAILALALGLMSVVPVAAQGFPTKTIRIVVPFAAGGNADVTARAIQGGLSRVLGQSVVIENKTGAGGAIGAREVAKSPADGYTLLFGTAGHHIIGPAMNKSIGYEGISDFTPVSLLGTTP